MENPPLDLAPQVGHGYSQERVVCAASAWEEIEGEELGTAVEMALHKLLKQRYKIVASGKEMRARQLGVYVCVKI